jgi:hypothetical protein
MIRFTVDLSNEIDERLSDIAKRNGITKAEAMRRAFALLAVADHRKAKGEGFFPRYRARKHEPRA